jgi:hypothetical protein
MEKEIVNNKIQNQEWLIKNAASRTAAFGRKTAQRITPVAEVLKGFRNMLMIFKRWNKGCYSGKIPGAFCICVTGPGL